jgi:uncharacterized membrane protein (DUF485 family)
MKELIIAYKFVWFRVACYFLIPFMTTFLALTETWSGDTWKDTHPFLLLRIVMSCIVSGITTFVAFIDQSMDRAKEKMSERAKLNAQP